MFGKILSITALALALTGCRFTIDTGVDVFGSGYVTSESRYPGEFCQVQLNGVGDIHIQKGYSTSVTVEADENIQSSILTYVSNRVLVISVRDGYNIHPSGMIRYTVSTRQLNAYTLNGTGDAVITGINTNWCSLTLNGAGNITADGSCDSLNVTLNGSGNIDASDLSSDTAYASLNGTGNITVWALNYLNARISGCGNINYYGDPVLDYSITGTGAVHWMGY